MGQKIKNLKLQPTIQLLMAVVVFLSLTRPALADRFDEQIAALRQQINQQQSQINAINQQQDSLQGKISSLNVQIGRSLSELQLAQVRHQQISSELEAANLELARKKQVLAQNFKTIYQESQLSPLEILASSGTLGEYMDRQEYLQSLRKSVQDSVDSITALKAKLEQSKQAQAQLIAEQQALQYGLGQQRSQVGALLAETQGQEAAYQAKIAAEKKKINELQAQQAAEIAARSRGQNYYGTGSYPWAGAQPFPNYSSDPWGFYLRQCTSYVAWKRAAIGRPLPAWGRMGPANANTWVNWARASGLRADRTPEVGAVGVYLGGPYGHVMVVKAIAGDSVLVTQYNADFTGRYSEAYWRTADLWFIH